MPDSPAIAFHTVSDKAVCGITEYSHFVVRDAKAWSNLWEQFATRGRFKLYGALPEVDFDHEMVIAIFLGSWTREGYSTRIEAIVDEGDQIVVLRRDQGPGPFSPIAFLQPHHIVRVPYFEKPVVFRSTHHGHGCNEQS